MNYEVMNDDTYVFLTSSSPSFFQMIDRVEQHHLPKFDNLTTLILDRCNLTSREHTMLNLFLQNAPKLENITLQNCKVRTHLMSPIITV
jgi:hypothetical protein